MGEYAIIGLVRRRESLETYRTGSCIWHKADTELILTWA